MELIRSAKFKLKPTAVQKSLLHNHFGTARFIFNSTLNDLPSTYWQKSPL